MKTIVIVTALLAAGPVAAQTTATANTTSECELHVWPAERFKAQTTGWLSGMGLIGALAESGKNSGKNDTNKAQMAGALDSPAQAAALASLDLPRLLGQQPARIIAHDTPLDRKTVNKIAERRAQSASPCYSELIVADLLYTKAAIYGRSLKSLFIYRNFGAAQTKPTIHKGWGGNGLKLFPPKDGEDVQPAFDELTAVFKADFEEFARKVPKPATRVAAR